jgi:hypothetical protein
VQRRDLTPAPWKNAAARFGSPLHNAAERFDSPLYHAAESLNSIFQLTTVNGTLYRVLKISVQVNIKTEKEGQSVLSKNRE